MKNIFPFLFVIILFLPSKTKAQGEEVFIDTVQMALYNLSIISSFQELYPYSTHSDNFLYFDFKEFEVLFYDCGYAFFTEKYVGSHPKPFFDLLEQNPKNKEIRPGSMLKFVNIVLQNDKHIMKGKPFVVKIIEYVAEPVIQEDDYDQEYWDNYWNNYNGN